MPKSNQWGAARFTLTKPCGAVDEITVSGRNRWALECRTAEGSKGCTPNDTPDPRWSAYMFNLRDVGVDIETVHEPHEGPFQGMHARYVLRSRVVKACGRECA